VLRLAVERDEDFPAPPVDRVLAAFAPDDRVAPAPEDLARVAVFLVPVLLRAVALRPPVEERAALLRELPEDEPDEEPELALASPSTDHLPDITRCAASATASAMIDPSLVALDMTLLAAAVAVSAASRPASRILRRAAGLALIAAAAAASPAASISLLIAALASLSTVSLPEDLDPEDFEELFFADLAIALSPSRGAISLLRCNGSRTRLKRSASGKVQIC
jgi:hypothetical protein